MRKTTENRDQSSTKRGRDDRQTGATRPLALRRETLRELAGSELQAADGGKAGGPCSSSRTEI
jgi:hypothetical protein